MLFVKPVLENGGKLTPLLIPTKELKGPSLMNPSIVNVDGKLIVNIRNVNYTLFHAEQSRFVHRWGPLCYIHPENDQTLTTWNIVTEFDGNELQDYSFVDTSEFDVDPLWEFVGLEDVRLVNWNDRLYQVGVRRDTTTNGVGRMELSEIQQIDDRWVEVSRERMPAPHPDTSYCEKNWMPIEDRPMEFVKWSNPVEVVKYEDGKTTTTFLSDRVIPDVRDWRGGSQLVRYDENHFIACIHEVNLFTNEDGTKNGQYRHRFLVWNNELEVVRMSPVFSFLDGEIEFVCGMARKDDEWFLTFSFQDNCAFILTVPHDFLKEFVNVTID